MKNATTITINQVMKTRLDSYKDPPTESYNHLLTELLDTLDSYEKTPQEQPNKETTPEE